MEFGFREKAHTADWELEVWAPNLPCLLEQAARGMYRLSGLKLRSGPAQRRKLDLRAVDAEGLLVRFLTELLWFEQGQGLGFNSFIIHVIQPGGNATEGDDKYSLQAELMGYPITGLDKEIKAVTYHNLHVLSTPEGLRVSIVFDV